MLLTIDIGNTHIFAGVFVDNEIKLRFRKASKASMTSDEYGLFFRQVLTENGIDPKAVEAIVISSVVPSVLYSISSACHKYFQVEPIVLEAGIKTGLKVQVQNPREVGADRIANAIGVQHLYPKHHKIIIDYGTATTFCALTEDSQWQGGLIVPGLRLAMEALEAKTAKLPPVEIKKPEVVVGRNTVENIQAGLYYATLGMTREVITQIKNEHFNNEKTLVIATGGFSRMFQEEGLFDAMESDLVLIGLWRVYQMNK